MTGTVTFDGIPLLDLPDRELRDLRGNRIAMIFQEPMTSLNPSYTIGEQIVEVLVRHRGSSAREGREKAIALLRRAGIPSPEQRIDDYPHKLSGGMRQRAMIAIALACDPELLIADEPTTALDVTIQAQILDLMRDLKRTSDAAIVLITHDLGVVAEVCDEVAVMYAGEIVERAPAEALFEAPQHPYTIGLLASIPRLDIRSDRLAVIEGHVTRHGVAAGRLPLRRPLSVRAGGMPRRAAADGATLAGAGRAACASRSKGSPHDRAGRGRGVDQAFRRAPFGVRPPAQSRECRRRRRLHGRSRKDAGAGRRIRLAASPPSAVSCCA